MSKHDRYADYALAALGVILIALWAAYFMGVFPIK